MILPKETIMEARVPDCAETNVQTHRQDLLREYVEENDDSTRKDPQRQNTKNNNTMAPATAATIVPVKTILAELELEVENTLNEIHIPLSRRN